MFALARLGGARGRDRDYLVRSMPQDAMFIVAPRVQAPILKVQANEYQRPAA